MITRFAGKLIAGAAVVLLLAPGTASADTADEAALAARFAPVVRLVDQPEQCGPGKPYVPTNVNLLLRNPTVALRGPWGGDDLVKVAPVATDLTARRYEYHLDFPGDALNPGCDFLRWSRLLNAGHTPTVYAHVVGDPAYPGRLALQYWMFYVYNDWNNLHEGDWEMIQLNFDAASAAQALHETPVEVGYSQHTGGERAGWGDDKLEIVGGVAPRRVSGLGLACRLLRSGALSRGVRVAGGRVRRHPKCRSRGPSGRGDDPQRPRHRRPRVSLDRVQGAVGRAPAGLLQRPSGPESEEAVDEADPGGRRSGGTGATRCPPGVPWEPERPTSSAARSQRGSVLLWHLVDNPFPTIAGFLAALAVVVILLSRATWRPAAPLRLARRRTWGQVITSAGRMYVTRWRLFLGIGVLFLPISLLITVLQAGVLGASSIAGIEDEGQAAGAFALIVVAIGTALTVLGITLVQAATAHALLEIDEGREVGPLGAYRMAAVHTMGLLGAIVIAVVAVTLLGSFILLLPVAIWLAVRWALIAPVVALEGRGTASALARSYRLVRGKWLKVASLTIASGAVVVIAGPLIGTGLILATNLPLSLLNVVAGVVYMVTMPFVALTTALRVLRRPGGRRAAARDGARPPASRDRALDRVGNLNRRNGARPRRAPRSAGAGARSRSFRPAAGRASRRRTGGRAARPPRRPRPGRGPRRRARRLPAPPRAPERARSCTSESR